MPPPTNSRPSGSGGLRTSRSLSAAAIVLRLTTERLGRCFVGSAPSIGQPPGLGQAGGDGFLSAKPLGEFLRAQVSWHSAQRVFGSAFKSDLRGEPCRAWQFWQCSRGGKGWEWRASKSVRRWHAKHALGPLRPSIEASPPADRETTWHASHCWWALMVCSR